MQECFHYTLGFASVSSTVSLGCISSPPSLSLPPAKWIYPDRQLDQQTIVGRAFSPVQPHKASMQVSNDDSFISIDGPGSGCVWKKVIITCLYK